MTETPSSSTYIPPWRRRQNLPEENNDTITRQSSSQNVRAISDNVPQRLKTSFSKPRDMTSSRRVETPRFRRNITYTFKKLKELTEKDPKTILLEITSRRNEFEELIGTDLTDDALVLVVKTLALVCTVDMVECKAAIMNLALKDGFHNSLRKFLLNLILHDSTDRKDSSYFWEDPARFFTDVAMVLQTLIETVPTKSGEVLPKTLVACTSSLELIFKEDPNPELLTMFDKLKKNLELCKTQVVKKTSRKRSDYYEVEPSDDFRDLSVYPTSSEVLSDQGYLRKHLIDRGYQNVHHYLDVQFRLLKEDFVGPLRDGIAEYMQYRGPNRSIIKASNVRIYTHVEFLKPIWSNGQVGVLLQFENSLWTSKVKFNFHKRFMYGSLLCFTRDNFRSLSFGKVIDSNSQLLQKRQVVVEFEQYVVGQPYIMVECSVFFEPYYQVLTALQDIDEEQFPMAKYIIHLDPAINIPSYLRGNNEIEANDLSQLNDSQYQAICDGLTKEFVVIQGPPGTGKTYLGLEMVKSLIKNKVLWYRAGPILIVCYTNHALDQFLEGLITTTYEIVRVGGRSRNINLNRFTLKEQRRRSRTQNYHRKAFYDIGDQVYSCLKSIDSYSNILKDIDSNSVLISFHQLLIFDEDGFFYLFENFTVEEEILWLLDDVSKKQERPQIHQEENVQEDDELTKEFEEIEFNQMRNKHLTDDYFWDDRTRESEEHILTSVSQLKSKIKKLQLKERQGKNVDVDKIHNELIKLEGLLNRLKINLKKYANVRVDKKPELKSPYSMSIDERWYFYLYFVEKYKETLNCRLIETQNKYLSIINQYNELKDVVDFEIMKNSLVVGMTTTAAARLQSVIKNLKCPIVIVEEAAEVLESHVVISLTPHCQHLILIGDHQQLKPSTSNFYIERQCNLGVSLFERMIRNNIRCHVLDVQHRMRPEIANLIVPAIYPKLENHPSVYEFPPVLGVGTNLYFIDHQYEEEESGDSSKLNMHETKFLICLARYLVQNGYKPTDITILAAYSGQMFALWKEQKNCLNLLEGVRITPLDNYQGEENKIILLSLVRNNKKGKIGFLKIENRVCVALSRAREGLYIMGNMSLLCENSKIWPKVNEVLVSQDNLGISLTLRCQLHPEHETEVTVPDDFNNVAEGGCHLTCLKRLKCGHFCTMLCHILDQDHVNYKCKEKCSKILCENGHVCPDTCWERCRPCYVPVNRILPCGHQHKVKCFVKIENFKCPTPVETELPCGHTDPEKPCHADVKTHRCSFPCNSRVEPCGHACLRNCHFNDDPDHLTYECLKPCERPHLDCTTGNYKCPNKCRDECIVCENIVEKRRSCTHKVKVPCYQDPNDDACIENCKRSLPCGHACKKKCSEPCGSCNVMVTKEIDVCKHLLKMKCSQDPIRDLCSEKCPLLLACGHVCQNQCNEPCTTSCKVLVDHENIADCGHSFKIECNLSAKAHSGNSYELLKFCDHPCKETLSCDHICSGTCGECAQGRIHKQCAEKCGAVLVCGHPCLVGCREDCQPCSEKCSYKCVHSACTKKCGDPCTDCKEQCARKCVHVACSSLCGAICTVPPCNEACDKILPCGHDCVGFCGDPCPPLCRVCDDDELTEIFFGDEDEVDAKFVVLDECGHVFESKGMDLWMRDEDNRGKIAPKCCPRCKTIITSTRRYSDYVKQTLKNLCAVKEKFAGTDKDRKQKSDELLDKINNLEENNLVVKEPMLEKLLQRITNAIIRVKNGRRQNVDLMQLTVYSAKVQIIENIIVATDEKEVTSKILKDHLKFLLYMLSRNDKKLSKQEIADFNKEVKRWSFLVQITDIQDFFWIDRLRNDELFTRTFENCKKILFSIKIFSESLQEEVVANLDFLNEKFGLKTAIIEFKIVKAMGMAKGHWFRCPNGHIYAIGECGGATQVGKCVDCKENIGGSGHRLLENNTHAREIDGSNFPAYSEEANNLGNYENLF